MGCATLKRCSEALTEPFLEAFIVPGNNILIGLKKKLSYSLLALTHRYRPGVLGQ